MKRKVFTFAGQSFVFASDHPKEERIVLLTDDYRAADGSFILPEALAWDGVETCPGVELGVPDEE